MASERFAAITRELDALEKVHASIAAVTAREYGRRRHDLIDMRRELTAQIARLGQAAEPLFDSAEDVDTARLYRAKFSRMRSMMAMHQASWPAVMLGEREEEFRASAKRLREANREFIDWMRETLARFR